MLHNLASWHNLTEHYRNFKLLPAKLKHAELTIADLTIDYSRNLLQPATVNLLHLLADEAQVTGAIAQLFQGTYRNHTENVPVLHTALRDHTSTPILVNNSDIKSDINAVLEQMAHFVTAVQYGQRCGVTRKTFTHIINIGVGGSYLGPQLLIHALAEYDIAPSISCHFIADLDETAIMRVLQAVDPERTLVIVASKSFTTLETIYNFQTVLTWLHNKINAISNHNYAKDAILAEHFVAITARAARARAWGINNIFLIWDWVGGRYSIWSAMGLIVALKIGVENFTAFLNGAYIADQHFNKITNSANAPLFLALLGIWYINFFGARNHAIIPYDSRLKYLPAYIQQLEMESNGKNITIDNNLVNYATGPVVWGGLGIHGQHSFGQLLYQGTHFIPIDFIVVQHKPQLCPDLHLKDYDRQSLLLDSALAQADAIFMGNQEQDEPQYSRVIGGKPSNIIYLPTLTPRTLGTLLALYEHKVFVQGLIWQINSFDQWGVELGKQIFRVHHRNKCAILQV